MKIIMKARGTSRSGEGINIMNRLIMFLGDEIQRMRFDNGLT